MLYESNSKLTNYSRNLRIKQTDAEKLLWSKLRGKQVADCKLYRQYSIDAYIIDFYCNEKKLADELDGSQHIERKAYDDHRTQALNSHGITVLRFWDNEVLNNTDGVVQMIYDHLLKKVDA